MENICLIAVSVVMKWIKTTSGLFRREQEAKPTDTASVKPATPNTSNNPLPNPVIPPPKPTKEQEFVKALGIAVTDGFDSLILYTHAYHETGNFKHIVGEWNYFGMKPPRSWQGKVIKIKTQEYDNYYKTIHDYFCDFANTEDCVKFYISQIKRLYPESYKNRKDAQLYFWGLTRWRYKWATSPTYSEKLIKLYADLKANGIAERIRAEII